MIDHPLTDILWSASLTTLLKAPAFSTKSIHEQEEVIKRYADDLMVAIKEEGRERSINLVEFFNWTTFDGTSVPSCSICGHASLERF